MSERFFDKVKWHLLRIIRLRVTGHCHGCCTKWWKRCSKCKIEHFANADGARKEE